VKGFGVTFTTMFKKVTTEQYPEQVKTTAPRFHGRHVLNRHPDGLEKCIGCELCAWACPADAIYVEGADNTDEARFSPGERYGAIYQINYLRCIFCGLCVEACPTEALLMTTEFELSSYSRAEAILTKEQLIVDEPIRRHWPTTKELPPDYNVLAEMAKAGYQANEESNVADEHSRAASGTGSSQSGKGAEG